VFVNGSGEAAVLASVKECDGSKKAQDIDRVLFRRRKQLRSRPVEDNVHKALQPADMFPQGRAFPDFVYDATPWAEELAAHKQAMANESDKDGPLILTHRVDVLLLTNPVPPIDPEVIRLQQARAARRRRHAELDRFPCALRRYPSLFKAS
jgi:hypothetical protein